MPTHVASHAEVLSTNPGWQPDPQRAVSSQKRSKRPFASIADQVGTAPAEAQTKPNHAWRSTTVVLFLESGNEARRDFPSGFFYLERSNEHATPWRSRRALTPHPDTPGGVVFLKRRLFGQSGHINGDAAPGCRPADTINTKERKRGKSHGREETSSDRNLRQGRHR